MTATGGRIAVGVSGAGTNLRALADAIGRGEVPARIALVFADRECPAVSWAEEAGIDTALVPAARRGDAKGRVAEDAALADLTRFVHEPTTPPPSATMNARIRQAAKRGAP